VYNTAKESVQKIMGGTPSADSDADVAGDAAADEDEAPLPYEEPATEDGDTDEPDWHNTDTNADPDYEPFDGERSCAFCCCVCCL
jgi:hypothetical protein